MTHICISKLTITDSDNGLSPDQCQAIIWTNVGILLIWTLVREIHTFSFKKMHLKMLLAKLWHFCLGLDVLSRIYSFPMPSLIKKPKRYWNKIWTLLSIIPCLPCPGSVYCHWPITLTHWGRVGATHICVSKLTIIIWTSAGILLIGFLRT